VGQAAGLHEGDGETVRGDRPASPPTTSSRCRPRNRDDLGDLLSALRAPHLPQYSYSSPSHFLPSGAFGIRNGDSRSTTLDAPELLHASSPGSCQDTCRGRAGAGLLSSLYRNSQSFEPDGSIRSTRPRRSGSLMSRCLGPGRRLSTRAFVSRVSPVSMDTFMGDGPHASATGCNSKCAPKALKSWELVHCHRCERLQADGALNYMGARGPKLKSRRSDHYKTSHF
jgi:hypothetical protein